MNPTSRFFYALFGRYPSDSELRLEIRPLLPEWKKAELNKEDIEEIHFNARKWYCLGPEYLDNAARYVSRCSPSFDVYFGVFPRVGRTGGQNDVPHAVSLFADVDGGDEGVPGAVQRIKESSVDLPDIAVQSGGGIHAYWLLDEPVPLPNKEARDDFKKTLRRLSRAIGGVSPAAHADTAACEVARILRVPQTYNYKQQDTPRDVKTLRFVHTGLISSGESLTLSQEGNKSMCRSYDWWRAQLPVEPATPGPKAVPSISYTPSGFISPGLENWARRGYAEGKRHQDFASAAAWLVRDCKLSKSDAAALLRIKAQNSPGRRAITAEEIEGIVKWA